MRHLSSKESDAIIDGLLLKIALLESEKKELSSKLDRLDVENYIHGQFIYTNRINIINDFSEFVFENLAECANSHGLDLHDVSRDMVSMLRDLSTDMSSDTSKVVNRIINKISE